MKMRNMLSTLIEKVGDLNDSIILGKMQDSLDIFYHPDAEIQKNDGTVVCGLPLFKKNIEHFSDEITDWRSAQPLHVAIGEGVTMVEWFLNYTHKTLGERKFLQVAVQEWENGKIIREKIYYKS